MADTPGHAGRARDDRRGAGLDPGAGLGRDRGAADRRGRRRHRADADPGHAAAGGLAEGLAEGLGRPAAPDAPILDEQSLRGHDQHHRPRGAPGRARRPDQPQPAQADPPRDRPGPRGADARPERRAAGPRPAPLAARPLHAPPPGWGQRHGSTDMSDGPPRARAAAAQSRCAPRRRGHRRRCSTACGPAGSRSTSEPMSSAGGGRALPAQRGGDDGRLRDRLRRRRQPADGRGRALEASGLTLGILPMGTANDLARTLGIPDDLDAAADVILAGHRRTDRPRHASTASRSSTSPRSASATELSPRAVERAEAPLGPARLRHRGDPGAGEGPALHRLDHRERRRRPAPAPCRSPSATAASTAAAPSSPQHAAIDDGHLDLYSLEMRTVWRLALMLQELPLRRARRLVRGHDAARHRVRDPHRAAAAGQRRRRDRRRDAGGVQGPPRGGHRPGTAPASPAADETRASPHWRIPASEMRF